MRPKEPLVGDPRRFGLEFRGNDIEDVLEVIRQNKPKKFANEDMEANAYLLREPRKPWTLAV